MLAAYREGRAVGLSYCTVGEPICATGLLIASVQLIYLEPTTRRGLLGGFISNALLNGTISWSKSRGTQVLLVHQTSGIEIKRGSRFFVRRGFAINGGEYVKKLEA